MEACWNFHNYIAIPLEEIGEKYVGKTFAGAGDIDRGAFVDAMLQVLMIEFGGLDKVPEFVDDCREYDLVRGEDIPKEKAIELFEEFKRLLKVREK